MSLFPWRRKVSSLNFDVFFLTFLKRVGLNTHFLTFWPIVRNAVPSLPLPSSPELNQCVQKIFLCLNLIFLFFYSRTKKEKVTIQFWNSRNRSWSGTVLYAMHMGCAAGIVVVSCLKGMQLEHVRLKGWPEICSDPLSARVTTKRSGLDEPSTRTRDTCARKRAWGPPIRPTKQSPKRRTRRARRPMLEEGPKVWRCTRPHGRTWSPNMWFFGSRFWLVLS